MPLNSSGPIDFNSIHEEAGGASASLGTINDADIRGLLRPIPSSGSKVDFSDFYGVSRYVVDFSIHKPVYGAGRASYGSTYGSHNVGNGSNWNMNTSSNNANGGGSRTEAVKSAETPLLYSGYGRNYEVEFDISVTGGDYFSASISLCIDTYTRSGFSNDHDQYATNGITPGIQLLRVYESTAQSTGWDQDFVYKGRHQRTIQFSFPYPENNYSGGAAILINQGGGLDIRPDVVYLMGFGGYCYLTIHSLTIKEI